MKGKIISIAVMLLVGQMTFAQESKITELTLQQCVQMAVDKNINVKTSRIDKEKSNYKKEESRAALLPRPFGYLMRKAKVGTPCSKSMK